MATPLGNTFTTDEVIVAQAYYKLMGREVESLTVEFDQQKYEEYLSSGSASPRQGRGSRKFASKTRSPTLAAEKTRRLKDLKAYGEANSLDADVTDAKVIIFASGREDAKVITFAPEHPESRISRFSPGDYQRSLQSKKNAARRRRRTSRRQQVARDKLLAIQHEVGKDATQNQPGVPKAKREGGGVNDHRVSIIRRGGQSPSGKLQVSLLRREDGKDLREIRVSKPS
jgi:hypothetical protein